MSGLAAVPLVSAVDVARHLAMFQHGTFTLDEVAAMTGISKQRLELSCRAGKVQHTQVGKFRRMTLAQIDLLLAAHRTGTTTGPIEEDSDQKAAVTQSMRAANRRPGRAA